MDNELKHLLERYYRPTAQKLEVPDLFSLVEEMMNTASDLILEIDDAPSEASRPGQKQLSITLPTIRLSEKMWGKEGTRDREILQNLLGKIQNPPCNVPHFNEDVWGSNSLRRGAW